MNSEKISPTDPRLSAYAFGEMDAAEAADFARLLEQDPAATQLIEELRAFGIQMSDTFSGETAAPAPAPTAAEPTRASVYPFPAQDSAGSWRGPVLWLGGLAAAACLTFVVVQDQVPGAGENFKIQKQGPSPAEIQERNRRMAEALMPMHKGEAAQTVSTVPLAEDEGETPDVPTKAVEIAPMVVEAQEAAEYRASNTVAGTRMATSIPSGAQLKGVEVGSLDKFKDGSAPVVTGGHGLNLPASAVAERDDIIELSPFSVSSNEDGYTASNTLAGTRLRTELADVSGKISVVTPQVLRDIGATSNDQLLRYTTNTEVAGSVRGVPAPAGKLAKPVDAQGEGYATLKETGFSLVSASPTSTFSIDVDTASYANVRRFLAQGQRPPREAVRIEELINFFKYRYNAPTGADPVATTLEVASAPWNPEHRLVRVGLKAKEIPASERPAANLVFLIDVSGSMSDRNKLPLVKRALAMLVEQLRPQDRVAIVVYAGASGLALPSTAGDDKQEILDALERLNAGGSTAGAMGIQLAYDVAKANFVAGGTNRVILCTDGDFNVGVTSQTELQSLIETKAKSGVFLTVLGFGMGNYKDSTLELLADKGNGNYGYVDSEKEARKLLVEQAGGTLVAVAKDVKVQVEFNPAKVAAYRLIGYENRRLNREDFANDRIDAGEMGAGHTVTALYEVVPVGGAVPGVAPVEPLRYGAPAARSEDGSGELLTVAVRYKPVDGDTSRKLTFPLVDRGGNFNAASADLQFAASVTAFGLVLTDSQLVGKLTLDQVEAWTRASLEAESDEARREFLQLVEQARVPRVR